MKQTLLIILLFISLHGSSQSIDSAWMNHYLQGYYQDTGKYLPQVQLYALDGSRVSLQEYQGKIVYINFWASWCANCIIRFPFEEQLHKRLKTLGIDTLIQFVNINVDDTPKKRKQAITKYLPEGINLYSGDTSIFTTWNINAIPRYLLLDTSGRILAKKMASPDDGTVDYILYAATQGMHPVQALWKQFEQNKLMEKHRTADAFTDKAYKEWFIKSLPSQLAYQSWRMEHKKQQQQKKH